VAGTANGQVPDDGVSLIPVHPARPANYAAGHDQASEAELVARRPVLPLLLIGLLPTSEQAQHASALMEIASPEDRPA
jgi:hypothetical protein